MNENINSDFTSKHKMQSGFKEIQNKNFTLVNIQSQDLNAIENNQARTPLKNKIFNFNNNNSKTPLNKNLLASQIANKVQINKGTQNPKDLNVKVNDLKSKKELNHQLLSLKENNLILEKSENTAKCFENLPDKFILNSKDDENESKIKGNLFTKHQLSDSDCNYHSNKIGQNSENKEGNTIEFYKIEDESKIQEESDYSDNSSNEYEEDSFDLDAHMKSEFDDFVKINEYNNKKLFETKAYEVNFSQISFAVEDKINADLICIEDEIREVGETKLDDEGLLLLNKQDFENFDRMKSYNIYNYKHNLDDLEIEEN